jgi:MerR family copper efflux transcriptional regulator
MHHRIFTTKTHREDPYLTIGKVAEITGASRRAIRLYEARGLIPVPQRRGKYRLYSERDVFLIHVLKFSQSFGFSLAEVKDLVTAKVTGKRFPLQLANAIFALKREQLKAQIEAIRDTDRRLVALQQEMNRNFG